MIKEKIKNAVKKIGVGIYRYHRDSFHTHARRPRYADEIYIRKQDFCLNHSVGIAVQGGSDYKY